jgi:uncharacterized membrane protein
MKVIFIYLFISFASGLLFVNIYTSIVDHHSWGSDFPRSMQAAREYFKAVNPGKFFRVFSPVAQVLALLALIFFWKTSLTIRILLAVALLFSLGADAMTFGYFYPRNDIMFKSDLSSDLNAIEKAWKQWGMMNWVRSLIAAIALVCSIIALHKYYRLT